MFFFVFFFVFFFTLFEQAKYCVYMLPALNYVYIANFPNNEICHENLRRKPPGISTIRKKA